MLVGSQEYWPQECHYWSELVLGLLLITNLKMEVAEDACFLSKTYQQKRRIRRVEHRANIVNAKRKCGKEHVGEMMSYATT